MVRVNFDNNSHKNRVCPLTKSVKVDYICPCGWYQKVELAAMDELNPRAIFVVGGT